MIDNRTTVTTRRRATILEDLAQYRHEAGRVTVADPDHAVLHAIINDLLDELEGASDG